MTRWLSLAALLLATPLAAAQGVVARAPLPRECLALVVEPGPDALGEVLDAYCRLFGWCWTADTGAQRTLEGESPDWPAGLRDVRVVPENVHRFVSGLLAVHGLFVTSVEQGSFVLLVLHAGPSRTVHDPIGVPQRVERSQLAHAAGFPALRIVCLIEQPTRERLELAEFMARWTDGDELEKVLPIGTSQLLAGRARLVATIERNARRILGAEVGELHPDDWPIRAPAVELPPSELRPEDFLAGAPADWTVQGRLAGDELLAKLRELAPPLAEPSAAEREGLAAARIFVRPRAEVHGEQVSLLVETLLLAQCRVLDVGTDANPRGLVLRSWVPETKLAYRGRAPFVRADELDRWRAHPALRVRTVVPVTHIGVEHAVRWAQLWFQQGEWVRASRLEAAQDADGVEIHGPVAVVAAAAEWLRLADEANARRGY